MHASSLSICCYDTGRRQSFPENEGKTRIYSNPWDHEIHLTVSATPLWPSSSHSVSCSLTMPTAVSPPSEGEGVSLVWGSSLVCPDTWSDALSGGGARREWRHSGQVVCVASQRSMQSMWNVCPHLGICCSLASASYSPRHTEHLPNTNHATINSLTKKCLSPSHHHTCNSTEKKTAAILCKSNLFSEQARESKTAIFKQNNICSSK